MVYRDDESTSPTIRIPWKEPRVKVSLVDLTKRFGKVVAVNRVALEIEAGEFVAFLGPSGCGKTTTLLMLAGIYRPSDGAIRFGERLMNQVPPQKRNIGMVFQSYALYPHMNALENMAFPLRLAGVEKKEQHERVKKVADLMGIGELLDRKPGQLSGGQQQRVALGRALVKEPNLLLFDEPLSNLDARLRLVMRGEIKRLQNLLGITSVYVTHDQVEALTMADRIAVMSDGELQAFDTPDDLYNRPRTQFIASFVGNPPMNFLNVTVQKNGTGFLAFTRDGQLVLPVPDEYAEKVLQSQLTEVVMGIRPEDIHLTDENMGATRAEVLNVEPLGRDDLLELGRGESAVFMLADPEKRVHREDTVPISINSAKVQFFHPETGHSLLWSGGNR